MNAKKAVTRSVPGVSPEADVLVRIDQVRSEFSKSERRIVDLLLEDTYAFARLNVKDIAGKAAVSEPTVVRFCRRLGYEGFKDLKLQIVQDLAYRQATEENAASHQREPSALLDPGSTPAAADAVFRAAATALERAHASLDRRAVDAAALAIAKARRVVIYGVGGSSAVMAAEAHNRLFRLDINSVPHTDSYTQRMSAATLGAADVAIFISSTGRPPTLLDTLELAKHFGATCIGITPKLGRLGRELDICIDLELTQGGVHPFHPNPMRYVQLYVIDWLAYGVALHLGGTAETALKRVRASVASLHGIAPLQPIGD
jgi:RpiR family transcriptional regulator, carbohydrate utilization regulator